MVAPVSSSGVGSGPGGGVVEVEPAGAVEGFFGGADVVSAWEDGVFVAVAAGEVDREAPTVGGAAVAQAEQWQGGAVGQLSADVGEAAVVGGWSGRPVVDSGVWPWPAAVAATRSWSTPVVWARCP